MKWPKLLRRFIVPAFVIICTVAFAPLDVFRLWIAPLPDTVQEQVDNSICHGLDGVIVYVDKKGSDPEFYSAGWNNRENKIPADPLALFKIASISKLFIAVAVAKLAHNKTISLDKTLADYLPELKGRIENADKITLRLMAQHRSGIPDFIDDPALPWSNLPTNTNEFLKLVLDKPADFKPNNRYSYSNTNYLLIGNILDKALGYSHHEFIRNEISDRLGLTHTFGFLSKADSADVSSGYYIGYEKDLKSQNYLCPGGSMISTPHEVGIFLRGLIDGTLLNQDEQVIFSSISNYEHTGLLPGYSSIARYHKEMDTVIILFVNTSGGNSWSKIEIIYNRIVRILQKLPTKQ